MLAVLGWIPLVAGAAEADVSLTIQDHRFQPETITVKAGTKVRLTVENRDGTPEEFESHALNREKVIPGKGKATIYIGPLEPGRYPFIGEFNEATAKGVVVAE